MELDNYFLLVDFTWVITKIKSQLFAVDESLLSRKTLTAPPSLMSIDQHSAKQLVFASLQGTPQAYIFPRILRDFLAFPCTNSVTDASVGQINPTWISFRSIFAAFTCTSVRSKCSLCRPEQDPFPPQTRQIRTPLSHYSNCIDVVSAPLQEPVCWGVFYVKRMFTDPHLRISSCEIAREILHRNDFTSCTYSNSHLWELEFFSTKIFRTQESIAVLAEAPVHIANIAWFQLAPAEYTNPDGAENSRRLIIRRN